MDLLSDILHQSGAHRRLLDLRALEPGTALRFPCERSIGLHAVTQGRVHVLAPTLEEPLLLEAGDVALMARGCDHAVSLLPTVAGQRLLPVAGRFAADAGPAPSPPPQAAAQVVSAAYQFWHPPLHPFLREMPPWVVLRAGTLRHLAPLPLAVGLLDAELRRGELGAATAVHGLVDALFTYALRETIERHAPERAGWCQAVRDPAIRRVLACLHERLEHPWTLQSLARQGGLSRTALAERFRGAMGDTPLNHLRTLRMQKARKLLADTPLTLEQVAQAVGYQDAFGFSKVFKRTTGLAPRAFRQLDAASRHEPWRLRADAAHDFPTHAHGA